MLKMNTLPRRTIIITVLAIAVLGALAIAGYYKYEAAHYVQTDDARVAADTVVVSPEISGKLISWQVKEGDMVKTGDVLGVQDLGASLNSGLTMGSISPQTMGALAGIMADKALVKAPISGQVIQSGGVVGEMASEGTPLAVIADVSKLYISANIKEDVIRNVHTGQSVDATIDAYPGRTFHGRVEVMGRATASTFSLLPSQNDSSNYTKVTQVIPVKIYLQDMGEAQLMPGMNSTIKIYIK